MIYKNITHWNLVEESKYITTFEESLQSKMIVLLDIEENLLIYALERKEELDNALDEAFKIEARTKGTSIEGKLKHAIKYIWELM
ncbi:MAG: hypothetical protein ACXABO_12550 [Promethearchaeota archaeon]|jgi:hypothetical protein